MIKKYWNPFPLFFLHDNILSWNSQRWETVAWQAQRWQQKSYTQSVLISSCRYFWIYASKKIQAGSKEAPSHLGSFRKCHSQRYRQQTPAVFFQHPFEIQLWVSERRQEHIHRRIRVKAANARNTMEVAFHRREMRKSASPWLLEATPWPSASSRVRNLTSCLSSVTTVNSLLPLGAVLNCNKRGQ